MTDSPYQLPHPHLEWSDDGAPRSGEFDDVYFSRAGGAAETDHVFLRQNRLETRWRALDPAQPGLFTIAETGFGTGLNCLATWALWRRCAPPGWRLLFLSAEAFPLDQDELSRALAQWPEYREQAAQLIAAWPPRLPGCHRREIGDGITLQLLYGDAAECLDTLRDSRAATVPAGFGVDAWFLDGFAPAKNPDMWSPALFAAIGRLSRPGTTFATFTAAGSVRRALQAAGFAVEKVAGFGSKREMLRGDWRGPAPVENDPRAAAIDYWSAPPPPRNQPKRVAVIGGGLAGTHCARALARRGCQVQLLEAGSTLASGASGNAQGVLYTRLSPRAEILSRFTLTSFHHALAHYRRRIDSGELRGELCGVLQLIQTEAEWQRLRQLFADHETWVRFLTPAQAGALAGCRIERHALWYADAGWLAPTELCARNVDHTHISVQLDCRVDTLTHTGTHWRLGISTGELEAEAVVIATAHHCRELAPAAALPLKPIRGQVTEVPGTLLAEQPRCVICHEGYLAPSASGITCGATFDQGDTDCALRAEDHRRNLRQQASALPGLLQVAPDTMDVTQLPGRVGFRATTPDYLPLVGPVPDLPRLRQQFAPLARNAKTAVDANHSWQPDLYINAGHGSRGLTSTPVAAELLAAMICGEARPLPRDLVQALSPARFAIRDLIRGR